MGFLTKRRPETKAVPSTAPYMDALVTLRDRSMSKFSRNVMAIALMKEARGYTFNCAHIRAMAAAQQTLQLYRSAPATSRSAKSVKDARRRGVTLEVRTPVRASKKHRMLRGDYGTNAQKAVAWQGVGGEVSEVTNHDVLNLLARPNPLQTGVSAAYQTFLMAGLTGEMFHVAVGKGTPLQLWPMLPQYTNPVPSPDDVVGKYIYGRDRSNLFEVEAEHVLHYKNADHPDDPYHGLGPLHPQGCYQAARIVNSNEDFDYELIENGNMPMAFISLDPVIYGDTMIEKFKKYLDQTTRGVAGKVKAVVGAGMSVTTAMPNAKDLQSIEKLAIHMATIRNAYGVSESMLDMNDANLASATVGSDQFLSLTLWPILCQHADFLTERLLPMFGLEPGEYWFAYENPLLADLQKEAAIAEIDLRSGVRSINEVREERMLDPVPDGDVYRINGVPLAEAGAQPFGSFGPFGSFPSQPVPTDKPGEEASVPAPQKIEETALNGAQIAQLVGLAEKVGLGLITRDGALAIAQASFPGTPPEKLTAIFSKLVEGDPVAEEETDTVPVVGTLDAKAVDDGNDGDGGTGGDVGCVDDEAGADIVLGGGAGVQVSELPVCKLSGRHARPDPFDLRDCGCSIRTKDDDDDIEAVVVPSEFISPEDAAKQTAALRAGVRSLQGTIADFILDAQEDAAGQIRRGVAIDLASLEDGLATALEPAFAEMYTAGFDLAGLEFDDAGTFEAPNPEALAEAQSSLVRQLSTDISDHTAQAIEARVQAGIGEGQSAAQMADAIEADTEFASYRAERIARTEVSDATNAGKVARYKEAGVTTKYWVNAPGASAVHQAIAAMHSDGVPIDEPFITAGTTITAGGKSENYTRDIYHPPARPNCRCSVQARKANATEGA